MSWLPTACSLVGMVILDPQDFVHHRIVHSQIQRSVLQSPSARLLCNHDEQTTKLANMSLHSSQMVCAYATCATYNHQPSSGLCYIQNFWPRGFDYLVNNSILKSFLCIKVLVPAEINENLAKARQSVRIYCRTSQLNPHSNVAHDDMGMKREQAVGYAASNSCNWVLTYQLQHSKVKIKQHMPIPAQSRNNTLCGLSIHRTEYCTHSFCPVLLVETSTMSTVSRVTHSPMILKQQKI